MLICTKIDIEDQIISFKYYCSPTALIICKDTNIKNKIKIINPVVQRVVKLQ